jgi:hypothetical protein
MVLLVVSSGDALAAPGERITTTDGKQYTRALNGCWYPSEHVRTDGTVSDILLSVPQQMPAKKSVCVCGDTCTCAPDACPAKCPVQQAAPAPGAPLYFSFPADGSTCPNCSGTRCPAPARRGFLLRR